MRKTMEIKYPFLQFCLFITEIICVILAGATAALHEPTYAGMFWACACYDHLIRKSYND